MKKKIFIHIGPHKTGSTYIQKMCFLNREKLAGENLVYLNYGLETHLGHHIFAKEAEKGLTPGLRKAICESESFNKDILVSSENFDRLDDKQVEALSELLSRFDAYVIFYKRRFDEILISTWQENVKHGAFKSWQEFLFENLSKPYLSISLSATSILDRYSKYFGKEKVVVIDYESSKINDIFLSMMKYIGISFRPIKVANRIVNKSMPYNLVEIIRALNYKHYSNSSNQKNRHLRRAFLDRYAKDTDFKTRIELLKMKIKLNKEVTIYNSFPLVSVEKTFSKSYSDNYIFNTQVSGEISYGQKTFLLPNESWTLEPSNVRDVYDIYEIIKEDIN